MNRDEPIPREIAALFAAERSLPPAPPAAVERVRARLASTLASVPATAGASVLSTKLVISLALAAVGITGVIAYVALLDRRTPAAVRVDSLAPPSPVDLDTPGEHTAQRESGLPADVEPSAIAASPPPHRRPEREILDEAMRCMSSGSAACALAKVAAHAREYPIGYLAEEREAIRVEALELSGDTTAAQEHAKAFLEQYPHSVHVTRVRQIAAPH